MFCRVLLKGEASFLPPKEVLKHWAEEPNLAGEVQDCFLGEQKGFFLWQKPLVKKKTEESGGKGLERSLCAGKFTGKALCTLVEGKKRGDEAWGSFFGGFG